MKKLKELNINSARLLRNEDLLIIRGGKAQNSCTCLCMGHSRLPGVVGTGIYGYLLSENGDCNSDCEYAFGSGAYGSCL